MPTIGERVTALETDYKWIRESLTRIESHLGGGVDRPKGNSFITLSLSRKAVLAILALPVLGGGGGILSALQTWGIL